MEHKLFGLRDEIEKAFIHKTCVSSETVNFIVTIDDSGIQTFSIRTFKSFLLQVDLYPFCPQDRIISFEARVLLHQALVPSDHPHNPVSQWVGGWATVSDFGDSYRIYRACEFVILSFWQRQCLVMIWTNILVTLNLNPSALRWEMYFQRRKEVYFQRKVKKI